METILIISFISLVAALALIGYVNFRSRKRADKLDLTIRTLKTQYSKMEGELMLSIDRHRVKKDLELLDLNNIISTVAQEHSLSMANILKISHTNAFLRTRKLKKAIGIKDISEVVAKGQGTAGGILKMWLKSPSHKKAIEGQWNKFGLSTERSILKRTYTTCIFVK